MFKPILSFICGIFGVSLSGYFLVNNASKKYQPTSSTSTNVVALDEISYDYVAPEVVQVKQTVRPTSSITPRTVVPKKKKKKAKKARPALRKRVTVVKSPVVAPQPKSQTPAPSAPKSMVTSAWGACTGGGTGSYSNWGQSSNCSRRGGYGRWN